MSEVNQGTPELDKQAWDEIRRLYGHRYEDDLTDQQFAEGWEDSSYKGERDERAQIKVVLERLAADNPELDYYQKIICEQPKREIGEYVLSQGFNVPLIRSQDDWQQALTDGTAFLRSEMEQDYAGQQGIFQSHQVPKADADTYHMGPHEIALAQALREGKVDEQRYMEVLHWYRDETFYYKQAAKVELPKEYQLEEYPQLTSSHWRWLGGLNIRMFRDPIVEGRYHFGTRSYEPIRSKSSGFLEADQHHLEIQGRYYDEDQRLVASRVIEFYEAIRALPRFDNSNAPLMELHLDTDNQLHFLQYYKTPQTVQPEQPFALPSVQRVDYIRGATPEEGINRRLYIEPRRFSRRLIGQACFLGAISPHRGQAQDMLSRMVDVMVTGSDISLRGTHADASMLYMPKLSICTFNNEIDDNLDDLANFVRHDKDPRNTYLNTMFWSNGREAVIRPDWNLRYDEVN